MSLTTMESVLAFQGRKSKTSLKPTYATGITGTLMFKRKSTYRVDGLINGGGGGGLNPGGLISGIIYSLANGWAYIRGA